MLQPKYFNLFHFYFYLLNNFKRIEAEWHIYASET